MSVQYWIDQIAQYDNTFKKWVARAEKIEKRYRDETELVTRSNTKAKFNILWSNVQTMIPAVFARLPKPDVSRRFRDNDPVGRVAALILERALEFEVEHYPDYRSAMKNSVQDRFLGGRGVAWVRYEPHISREPGIPEDGVQVTEDADALGAPEVQEIESLDYECAPCDYVHWKDFGHIPARTWEEVPAVWRCVYMGREALIERFGEELGKKIPLDTKPEALKKQGGTQGDTQYEACIYEIWDKKTGKAYWLSKSMPEMLDERDDPLELENFFPCPKPLYATLTTDTLVPVPDFTLYQDQAATLDTLAARINGFVEALKVQGCYDAAIPELSRMFTESKNTGLTPVKNWAAFAEKNGLQGAISLVDLKPIYEALIQCYGAMDQQKQQVYEITGIADIVRGQGDAGETATAQRIKGQYASLRLRSMQNEVAQFAAELLQLKAQIICRFFQPESIAQMASVNQLNEADKQYIGPALELLKNEQLSEFRIEVSADSLVQIDEDAEKQAATEFVGAVGEFIKQAAEAPPETVPLMASLLKWAATRFKVGKAIEGDIDAFADAAKQNAQQPQPDPEAQKLQAQQQQEQMRMQAEQAAEQARMQADMAIEAQRMQMEERFEQQRMALEQRANEQRLMLEGQLQAMQMQYDRWKAELDAATKIEAANISAKAKVDNPATQAATAEIASEVQQ